MRFSFRWLIAVLCLCLALPNGLCESASGITQTKETEAAEAAEKAEETEETEEKIEPAYPVPDYVEWLIETAQGELGYTEEAGGVTKYGTWAGYPAAEWCAEFLCWCVHRVDQAHGTRLLTNTYPKYSGTNVGRDWFLSQGRYIARTGSVPSWGAQWWKDGMEPIAANSYIPQPGDWVFFSDNAKGDTCHVALVEYCAKDENGAVRVHVIEGNNLQKPAPQSVERNDYALDYWQILGYGTVRDLADISLRFGHSGPKVLALQQDLIAAGLMEAQYNTGRFGAITEEAVKRVQRMNGIVETGIANLETRQALNAMILKTAGE